MNFKSKNDINYFKFLELSIIIGDSTDERFIVEETYKIFNPKNINFFTAALESKKKAKRKFRVNLDFKTIGTFIDADTYSMEKKFLELFNIILKPKMPWYKIKNISLAEAELVMREWVDYCTGIKEQYEYIYNPPIRVQSSEMTQGAVERNAFSEHYGGYAEIVYVIAMATHRNFKQVFKDDLHYFLFWGEYLLRKKEVENLK